MHDNNRRAGAHCYLLDILQHHIAVPIERLDTRQQLVVVTTVDQHLGVVLDGKREHGQWAGVELFLLELADFLLCHV